MIHIDPKGVVTVDGVKAPFRIQEGRLTFVSKDRRHHRKQQVIEVKLKDLAAQATRQPTEIPN